MRLRATTYLLLLLILAGACSVEPPDVPIEAQPDPTPPADTRYTPDEIAYFYQIALGSEFGSSQARIRKWKGTVRVQVKGSPSAEDVATVEAVVDEINTLTDGRLMLEIVESRPAITLWFVELDEMRSHEPNYVDGNWGFFWTNWDEGWVLYHANVLVATDVTTQHQRNHLIREELTQSLGLMRDANTYPESIFYGPWTETQSYAPIDRKLVEMLYLDEVKAGMKKTGLDDVFSHLQ